VSRSADSIGEDVLQAHESDELEQVVGRMAQPDTASHPPRRELKPSEGVDCHRIGGDAAHVAEGDVCAALSQQRADTIAEPAQVSARDRAADCERERVRPWRGHRE
jgi:hypothetical protein